MDWLKQTLYLDSQSGILGQLGVKVIAITIIFLLITPLFPFYQDTEGYYGENEINLLDIAEQDPDSVFATVMTEDGFLLKPSLNTTEGDRSMYSEVFAYSVEPGDTLSSIAQRFGLKKETIMWENNLWDANQVKTGMTLKILPVDGVSHLVKKGQTLNYIAKKYKVEKAIIVKQNQLEEENLADDTLLIIPGAKKAIPMPSYGAPAPAIPPAGHFVASGGRLFWPVEKGVRITQGFRRGHYAVDLANRGAGPVYAAASGKIIVAKTGWNGGYGNHIIIDHGNGMQTLYAHNSKLYVADGQYVEQGQTIAWMGSTGKSSGVHLHFEVRVNGVKYNPLNFF